jgi:hypothetical protein
MKRDAGRITQRIEDLGERLDPLPRLPRENVVEMESEFGADAIRGEYLVSNVAADRFVALLKPRRYVRDSEPGRAAITRGVRSPLGASSSFIERHLRCFGRSALGRRS